MAHVTVNSRYETVEGNLKVIYYDVSAAASDDVIPVENHTLNKIYHVAISPATAIAAGYALSSGDIVIYYAGGGAAANIKVRVAGL